MALSFTDRRWIVCTVLILALNSCAPAPSSAPPSGESRPVQLDAVRSEEKTPVKPVPVPPRVAEHLQRLTDFYKSLNSFTVKTSLELKFEQGTNSRQATAESVLSVQRPNKLSFRTQPGQISLDMVADGRDLFISVPALKRFSREPAPAALQELKDSSVVRRLGGPAIGDILFLFTADNLQQQLCESVTWYDDRGTENIEGKNTRHLRFSQAEGTWDLWFDAEKEPLIRQVSRSAVPRQPYSSPLSQVAGTPRPLSTTTRRFSDWQLNPTLPPETFAFVPAVDSKEIHDDLFAPPSRSGKSPKDFLGKSLPDVKLNRLEGGSFQFKDHLGKDVVLLDFWATWCGECRVEMPVVTEIAAEYADKHVATYAVNCLENSERIEAFLKKYPLKLPILLDVKGELVQGLNIELIPVLLLIDRQGVLQAVHVGYNKQLKATLKRELDALIAGKSLLDERSIAPK